MRNICRDAEMSTVLHERDGTNLACSMVACHHVLQMGLSEQDRLIWETIATVNSLDISIRIHEVDAFSGYSIRNLS